MFVLKILRNPLTSELYDFSVPDLFAGFYETKFFNTREGAWRFVEAEVALENERNAEFREDECEKLRLLDEEVDPEDGLSTLWVFGVEDDEPFLEAQDSEHKSSFWWFSCEVVKVEGE